MRTDSHGLQWFSQIYVFSMLFITHMKAMNEKKDDEDGTDASGPKQENNNEERRARETLQPTCHSMTHAYTLTFRFSNRINFTLGYFTYI